eukprot:8181745-Alexandrium_andersonii.AAC.1
MGMVAGLRASWASSNSATTQVQQRRRLQENASCSPLQFPAGFCCTASLWGAAPLPPPDPPNTRLCRAPEGRG